MVKLLRQLISGLSDTVDVWDQFSRKEIGYFRCQSDPPTASSPLKSSIAAIENAFWKLKVLRGKLHNLREELCAENPQGVSCLFHYEFEFKMHQSTQYLRDIMTNQYSSMLI
jgi:hypothetical protein